MNNNRNIWIIIAIVLLCLCAGTCIVFGAIGFFTSAARELSDSGGPVESFETPVVVVQDGTETPTAESGFGTPELPPPTDSAIETPEPGNGTASLDAIVIPPEISAQMDAIQEQVEQIRGLQPNDSFTRVLFTPDHLRERVINDFFADYSDEEARDDAWALEVFGLLERDYDLIDLYTELYSEQIGGFYDDDTKEMVVVQGDGFFGLEKLTYAHEYMHALQDKNFSSENGLLCSDEEYDEDSESCAARQALIEGEAFLLELSWFFAHATAQDQQDVIDFYDNVESPVFDSAPAFLQEDFVFPYNQGYDFAQALYDQGGWAALDAAYADLPASTEQILHPEKYPADVPILVELPDLGALLGDGWELYDNNVMGEWYTYLILGFGFDPSARITQNSAAQAAEGWGGDRYQVLFNREEDLIAMALVSTWDTTQDAVEFASAFEDFADARYGVRNIDEDPYISWETSTETVIFLLDGDRTTWISAPDAATAESMMNAIQSP